MLELGFEQEDSALRYGKSEELTGELSFSFITLANINHNVVFLSPSQWHHFDKSVKIHMWDKDAPVSGVSRNSSRI